MTKLIDILKEIGKFEVAYNEWPATKYYFLNFKHSIPSEDGPKFILRWEVNISEGFVASHYFYNGQIGKGISSIVIGEAVKYGLQKLTNEYIPKNQEKIINFLGRYLGKKIHNKQ